MKLTIAYLGDSFLGWQRQPEGRTVQGELERALAAMTKGPQVPIVGAGRTDAGVHAAGQVAHLDLVAPIPAASLRNGLNRRLPREIRVRTARAVSAAFHARRSARAKLYTYRLGFRESRLPWHDMRRAVTPTIADPAALGRALELLPGSHDVASFTVPEAAVVPTQRTLFRVWLRWRRDGLDLHFIGDGFLRYQVRRMVGALLEVGRGRLDVPGFHRLLLKPRPGAPLPTAPPGGLTLEHVWYRPSPRTGA